jgi:hypothetical protein
VFDGRLSLYVDGPPLIFSETAQDVLKNGMDNDQFLSAHEDLRKVTFIALPDNPIENDDLVDDDEEDEDDSDPISFFSGSLILAAAVGLGLAITLCLTVRRRRPIYDPRVNRRTDTDDYRDWEEDIVTADDNTVVISNRGDVSEDMRVNVDIETYSDDGNNVGNACFELFDMFLEGTSKDRKKPLVEDDISTVSF